MMNLLIRENLQNGKRFSSWKTSSCAIVELPYIERDNVLCNIHFHSGTYYDGWNWTQQFILKIVLAQSEQQK